MSGKKVGGGVGEGRPLSEVTTPCLLLDRRKMEANCARMLNTCRDLGLTLRAQTKTHKTVEGAVLQTGGSRRGLVTSTLTEAEMYADAGFDDILYGFPFIPAHLPRVARLTSRLEQFHVMVDSLVAVQALSQTTPPPGKTWSLFLKVDCGNARAGVWWQDMATVAALAELVQESSHARLHGLYVHCGNSYGAASTAQVEQVRDTTIERLVGVAEALRGRGLSVGVVGIGSTPTCSRPAPSMAALTELHPGNYPFYDVQQWRLGSCGQEDIAVCVATRVLGHYPSRNQMLVDCGFTALTMQGAGQLDTGYGVIRGHPNLRLCKMTQEVGFVETLQGTLDFDKFPIGSLLFVLPWHSCATASQHPVYHVVDGDRVVDQWTPCRGW